jgi:hypothetical protein
MPPKYPVCQTSDQIINQTSSASLCPLPPSLPTMIHNVHTMILLELKSLGYNDVFGDFPPTVIQSKQARRRHVKRAYSSVGQLYFEKWISRRPGNRDKSRLEKSALIVEACSLTLLTCQQPTAMPTQKHLQRYLGSVKSKKNIFSRLLLPEDSLKSC